MKKKTDYSDEPLGDVRVVRDFLPSPEELAFKDRNVKVTLLLSEMTVKFFKEQADRYHTKYQKMIRNLLDEYVGSHSG